MTMNRSERRRLGLETVALLERGHYEVEGARVDIEEPLAAAVAGTVEHTCRDAAPAFRVEVPRETRIEVRNEGCLSAAASLHAAGHRVAVLNFASAKNPGGGFLSGARAQEESLAMSSGLYACLLGREMYEHHRPTRGGMYTAWVIYSPRVPVIRDEAGALLRDPFEVSFLTSPAPNAGVVLERDPSRRPEITEAMRERIDKVLAVAAHHGHDALVLGAWGCGVFRNDPTEVAGLFGEALEGRFAGAFARVVFAVLDSSEERRFIGPFERRFG